MCTLRLWGDKFAVNVSVTYRPSGQTQELDTEMYQILQQSLHNRESVFLGDFNLHHIDWQTLTGVETESHRML